MRPMRIALAVDGTRGDVHPMLALGDRLRARGHEIVVCASPDFQADAQELGLPFHPVGLGARETLSELAEAVVSGGLRMLRATNDTSESSLRAQFAALPGRDRGRAADRRQRASRWRRASVAERHGAAYRYVAYVPEMLPSSEHAPILLPLPQLPRWANRLAWWLLMRSYNALLRGQVGARASRARARAGARRARPILTDRPLLAADPELAPLPADLRERIDA